MQQQNVTGRMELWPHRWIRDVRLDTVRPARKEHCSYMLQEIRCTLGRLSRGLEPTTALRWD